MLDCIRSLFTVRDAVARLPNGEGTRADVCELLKDSQYIAAGVTDAQINTVVSGALDRLHYEKDPCVKYDVNRKLWIYLHRNRTGEDFGKTFLPFSCVPLKWFGTMHVMGPHNSVFREDS